MTEPIPDISAAESAVCERLQTTPADTTRLQERLGNGENAFTVEYLAITEPEALDFGMEGNFSHHIAPIIRRLRLSCRLAASRSVSSASSETARGRAAR